MLSSRDIIIGLGVSLLIGIVGAIPFGMLGLLFGGVDAGRDIYLLQAIILGGWLPLKVIVDTQIKGQTNFRLPNITLNQLSGAILMFGLGVIIFVMYFATFTAFLLGALAYGIGGGNLALAVVIALVVQISSMIRGSTRERDLGINNGVFVRMQDFGTSNINIQIDPDQVRRQTPYQDMAPRLITPEETLRDRSQDDGASRPMTIDIDPTNVSEKSDDDA